MPVEPGSDVLNGRVRSASLSTYVKPIWENWWRLEKADRQARVSKQPPPMTMGRC